MKITFVTNNWINLSGGARVISIYADRLQKKGHEVFVVCPRKQRPTLKAQLKSILEGKGLIPSQLNQSSHFDGLDVPRKVVPHCEPIVDADVPDADVVIANFWKTAEWVANLSPIKGAKAYFIQHHEIHDYFDTTRVQKTYLLPLHKIVISNWLVEVMKTEYGDTDISFVPNSVDSKVFYAPPRKKQAISTFGMQYAPQDWKGCDIMIESFLLARQQIPDLKLIAFGKTDPPPSLAKYLAKEVVYYKKPSQTFLKDIYSSCDAWLFGSRLEGFGLPILEAMACRTPVIATPAGAAPELLASGGGMLVKPESPEDMSKAIVKICQMSELEWKNLSDAAYNQATSYSWDDATNLFEAALQTAIAKASQEKSY